MIATHPYFLWNGVNSENYGIIVSEYPVISRPKERVNQITIPGRSGVLMLPESDLPVYEPVLKTAQCWVKPDADIDAICAWLQGSGSVVFGNEPNRSHDARIINQIDFSKILRGRGYRSFAVPFQCQPYKRLYPPAEDITLTASGMTVHNPGTVPAWPKFTLYGSGTITLTTYSNAVVLSGIGNGIILDWQAQECMSLDGGTLLNDKVDGDPQYLPPGDSTITWTGTVSRLVVTPNWRFFNACYLPKMLGLCYTMGDHQADNSPFVKEDTIMRKAVALIAVVVMMLGMFGTVHAEAVQFPGTPVIGIAWRADTDSEFFTNICKAVEAAGATWVMLDQVQSADLDYDADGKLTQGVTALGSLDETAAKYVRMNTWHDSNAETAVGNVSIVLFTGGEDISPTLYYTPEPWHGIVAEIDYNAERDVSDYLTMTYCLDHDIPLMGFCRGMQMLSVVSGGEAIQDVPAYFAELGIEYGYEHRNQKATPDSYRDYAPHDVQVVPDSYLYEMAGTETLKGCPSWHHQAVKSVDNTRLVVTGYTETNGIQIIEAIERTDKTFAVGLQFHPEAALVKHLENAENQGNYMDYDTALSIFQWIVQEGYLEQENAA